VLPVAVVGGLLCIVAARCVVYTSCFVDDVMSTSVSCGGVTRDSLAIPAVRMFAAARLAAHWLARHAGSLEAKCVMPSCLAWY